MRNYELIRVLYEELTTGDGKGSFKNPYLNTVITVTKMIEEERPEIKEALSPVCGLADQVKEDEFGYPGGPGL